MECRIIEKSAFNFVGVSKRVPMQFEGVNNAIVDLANSITQEQREEMKKLIDLVDDSYEKEIYLSMFPIIQTQSLRKKKVI